MWPIYDTFFLFSGDFVRFFGIHNGLMQLHSRYIDALTRVFTMQCLFAFVMPGVPIHCVSLPGIDAHSTAIGAADGQLHKNASSAPCRCGLPFCKIRPQHPFIFRVSQHSQTSLSAHALTACAHAHNVFPRVCLFSPSISTAKHQCNLTRKSHRAFDDLSQSGYFHYAWDPLQF